MMNSARGGFAAWVSRMIIVVCLIAGFCGCTGNGVSRKDLETIDTLFRRSVSSLDQCTSWRGALENFNLERTDFVDQVLVQIQKSEEACSKVLASLEELRAVRYRGETSKLADDVMMYCDAASNALEELEAVFTGLEKILESVDPVLKHEKEVPAFGGPETIAEALRRLASLKTAAEKSLRDLQEIEVPEVLAGYKSFFFELIYAMGEVSTRNISLLQGKASNFSGKNEDYQRMELLQAQYPQVVEKLFGGLKINMIDSLVEKIELEINRLILEGKD